MYENDEPTTLMEKFIVAYDKVMTVVVFGLIPIAFFGVIAYAFFDAYIPQILSLFK